MKKKSKKEKFIKKNNQTISENLDKQVGAGQRLLEKEQGRKLDTFYNWSIIIIIIAIVLVFVLAFVI